MRSADNVLARSAIVALLLATGPPVAVRAAQERPQPQSARHPDQKEIVDALARVKADPNLTTEGTIKVLRWKDSSTAPSVTPTWLEWLAGFFRWVDQSMRVLMWCAVAILAGFLALYLVRIVRARGRSERDDDFIVPTHVRDLDIRPDSLPADIGGTARQLWDRGEHRAALSLLYRGMLSRLAHVHRVPIRDASTEGDCLALAAAHLPQPGCEYATRLVRIWQRFVYGRIEAQAAAVYGLCDEFGSALDVAAGGDPVAPEGAR